jgi:DNA-binding MarR family transcriptional regulator
MSQYKDTISELEDSSQQRRDHVDRAIAQWAEVRPDLDLAPASVVQRLGRALAYIDAGVNRRLEEFGLTRASWDVLAGLRRSGPPHRLSPTELYLSLMRSSGAMTHRLTRLERAGLVRRVPDPDDGRGMLVELTARGRRLVDRVAPEHLANERALLDPLTDDERSELARLLRKLLLAFEAQQPVPPPSGRGGRRRAHRRRRHQ